MNIMPLLVGWRDVRDDQMAARLYRNLSTQLFEGPFYMWMEKTAGSGGAPNYLTSPGGWLQATWAGWGGVRLVDAGLLVKNAAPPPGCTSMTMHGLRFRGYLLDITVAGGQLRVSASKRGDAAAGSLEVVFADGSKSGVPATGPSEGTVRIGVTMQHAAPELGGKATATMEGSVQATFSPGEVLATVAEEYVSCECSYRAAKRRDLRLSRRTL